MQTERLLVVVCLAGTLLGCGQKGPLVLPDAQHPHKKIGIGKPAATPAPAGATPAPAGSPPAGSPRPNTTSSSGDASAPGDATSSSEAKTAPAPPPPPP